MNLIVIIHAIREFGRTPVALFGLIFLAGLAVCGLIDWYLPSGNRVPQTMAAYVAMATLIAIFLLLVRWLA